MEQDKTDDAHPSNQSSGQETGNIKDAPEHSENGRDQQNQGSSKRKVGIVARAKQSVRRTSNWNKAMVLLTAVIAVSNGCYVHYARKQFRVMNGQLYQISLQYPELQKSANAAQQSVNEARLNRVQSETAFKATVDQFRLEQRAWLTFTPLPMNIGQKFVIVSIENTGKTPAKHIQGKMEAHIVDSSQSPDFAYHLPTSASLGNAFPGTYPARVFIVDKIGPNWVHIPYAQAVANQINQSNWKMMIFGRLTYQDDFGGWHFVQFCNTLAGPDDTQAFQSCADYNDGN